MTTRAAEKTRVASDEGKSAPASSSSKRRRTQNGSTSAEKVKKTGPWRARRHGPTASQDYPSPSSSERSLSPSPSASDVSSPSEDSAEGRLSRAEETESFLASLLDIYYGTVTLQRPLIHLANLRARFERAGRRPSQLDKMTEIIVLGCMAFGALLSDHPLLVGKSAPRLSALGAIRDGYELRTCARRRSPTCHRLVGAVVQLVDERGCFRIASHESLACLWMAFELTAFRDGYHILSQFRPFGTALLLHLLHLKETTTARNEISPGIEWHVQISEALLAAYEGSMLISTDDDLEMLLGPAPPSPSLERGLEALDSTDGAFCMRTLQESWYSLILLNRRIARTVSIPIRRRHPVEVSVLSDRLKEANELFQLALAGHNFVKTRQSSSASAGIAQAAATGYTVAQLLWVAPFQVANFWPVLSRQLRRLKENRSLSRSKLQEVSPEAETEEAAWNIQLRKLEYALVYSVADVLDLIAEGVRTSLARSPSDLVAHQSSMSPMQLLLPTWAKISLRFPCAELGGMQNFPWERKRAIVSDLILGLRHQAWCWESCAVHADVAAAALAVADEQMRQFHLRSQASKQTSPEPSSPDSPICRAPSTPPSPSPSGLRPASTCTVEAKHKASVASGLLKPPLPGAPAAARRLVGSIPVP